MSSISTAKVLISNKLGLHARPAMVFVETANEFNAQVMVRRCDSEEVVDGKSIMQMMMLAATQGTEIEIKTLGDDHADAIKTLVDLVKSKFKEE